MTSGEVVPPIPEPFTEKIERLKREHIAVLNRLEPHLGCVLCRGSLTDGRCPKCQNSAHFHWQWPKFNVYVPADKKRRAMLNRYPHNVIGAAVVLFGRCWGVTWKSSR